MNASFALLLFRDDEVPEAALARGFAIAVAGWDVVAPHLLIAQLRGLPGWSVAFYESGSRDLGAGGEFEHACDLFEDEIPPADYVLAEALALGQTGTVLHALTYSDAFIHDDAWTFSADGVARRFV